MDSILKQQRKKTVVIVTEKQNHKSGEKHIQNESYDL